MYKWLHSVSSSCHILIGTCPYLWPAVLIFWIEEMWMVECLLPASVSNLLAPLCVSSGKYRYLNHSAGRVMHSKDLQCVSRLSLHGILPVLTFIKRLEGWADTSSQHGLHKGSNTSVLCAEWEHERSFTDSVVLRKKGAMLWLIMLYWDFFFVKLFFPPRRQFSCLSGLFCPSLHEDSRQDSFHPLLFCFVFFKAVSLLKIFFFF